MQKPKPVTSSTATKRIDPSAFHIRGFMVGSEFVIAATVGNNAGVQVDMNCG